MLHECEVFPFSACESISFLTFPPHCFPKQTEEMRRPLPHNSWSTFTQHDLLRESPCIRGFLSGSLEFLESIWERERCGPFSCLGKMVLFTSECSWFQEERLHCLLPISYIVLNKPKIIWQKELSIWRSDSWKCWNTHLAQEPQISHNQ